MAKPSVASSANAKTVNIDDSPCTTQDEDEIVAAAPVKKVNKPIVIDSSSPVKEKSATKPVKSKPVQDKSKGKGKQAAKAKAVTSSENSESEAPSIASSSNKAKKDALSSRHNPFSATKKAAEKKKRAAEKPKAKESGDEEGESSDFDVLNATVTSKRVGNGSPPKPKAKRVKKSTTANEPEKKKKAPAKKKVQKKVKPYVPRKGTGAAALLIGLYVGAAEEDDFQDAGLNKDDLTAASVPYYSKLSSKSYDEAVKALVEAELVIKEGRGGHATVSLTKIGMSCAISCAQNQGGVEMREIEGVEAFDPKKNIAKSEDEEEEEQASSESEKEKPKKKKRKTD